jgi:hypothetical protein
MASQRKQINVRVDEDTESRIASVQASASTAMGLQLSVSDLFRLGLIELEKKYPSQETSPAKKPARGKK